MPIIPFGAGTSLEGHINAPQGGFSVDFTRMNRILAVNERDLDSVVEPGVSRKQLNDYLRDMGLFFPVDPGAEEATIGGMASTRASGTTALRYGTMRENVLNVTAVMADGSVVKTAQRARKSAAGYDLTRLMVGSEGTLGIITEVTVRLYGIPETILSAVCPFKTLEGRLQRRDPVDPARPRHRAHGSGGRCRHLRRQQIRQARRWKRRRPCSSSSTARSVSARNQVELFRQIAEGEGAIRFDWAEKEEDRRRLWKARHEFYWAVKTTWPGKDTLATDVCVPISRLAECVVETQEDIEAPGLVAPIAGHVGDGNFHTQPMFDRSNPKEMAAVETFMERLAERAIAMEGTCTGEHGIGQGKAKYLKAELGDGLGVMRSIKQALDPLNIMNPGKILPD